jgi:ribosome-associated protein
VSDHVEEMLRHDGDKPFSVQGRREGQWVVLDYVDVIVHLFDHAFRKHYDLEILWGDAPHVDWETESKQPESAA